MAFTRFKNEPEKELKLNLSETYFILGCLNQIYGELKKEYYFDKPIPLKYTIIKYHKRQKAIDNTEKLLSKFKSLSRELEKN